jgi:Acetyltransferases, including N-acetylases of ribosomal proteins
VNHKGTVDIETNRLLLRKFTLNDAQAIYDNWASDSEVTKYLMWSTHDSVTVSRDILKDWIKLYEKEDFYQWAIVFKDNKSEPIGTIGVTHQDNIVGMAHIGYCIGRKYWHKGITSEALKSVMDYLFDRVEFKRIESRHDSRNPNSGAVMKKCGMKYEGTLRMADWNNQGICDACYYALLSSER